MNNTQAIAANLAGAMAKIHHLKEKLRHLEEIVKEWQIEFSFEVDSVTRTVYVKAAKPYGGSVTTFPISFDTFLMYQDDPHPLINLIADQVYASSIKDSLRDELSTVIVPVLQNVSMVMETQ